MRIAIADNNSLKFCQDLKEHWEKKHEVKYETGASEHLAQWADLYYVDTWDNNLAYLWKLYNGKADPENYPTGWDNNKKPIIVVRALDWEVWLGHWRDQSIIDWVDKVICIAPHIEKELRKHADFKDKLKYIKPGVNLEKFTLKKKKTDGFQLGMVLGDMWWPKNHMAGLDIFTTLYRQDNRWKFHIRGQHEGGNEFWKQMFDYYINSRDLQDVVFLYDHQEDMNEWYENIDILLHPGMKEAFCYAVGEAMAKGIPVFINDFYGSHDIWEQAYLYKTHAEVTSRIKSYQAITALAPDDGTEYRQYIQDNYSLERQLKETDEWLGT